MNSEALTRRLGGFAAELQYEDLPAEVVAHAQLCILDTLGCALFGSSLPWVEIVRKTVQEEENGGDALLWGSGGTATKAGAAMVNGTAVHAFELDDLHPRSIVHPGSVVLSAALGGAAGRALDGKGLLTAVVAGYETAARVGMAVGAAHLLQGWHPTGTHGSLGAAAAAGHVLDLDADAMTHALGTAGSMSSGLMAAQFSSMVKRLHAGHAAQSGVIAALLARRGFRGTPDLLENEYGGYLSTFSPRSEAGVVLAGLGEDWQVAHVGFKRYSTNGSCHPSIDVLRDMLASETFDVTDVEDVTVHCSTATYKHVGWPYAPASVTTAQMNLPYIVAVVLSEGDAFVDQFTENKIHDPALVELSQRVRVEPDSEIDAGGDTRRHATRLTVRLRDGRTFQDEREYARGSARAPLDVCEVRAKFRRLASKALAEQDVAQVETLVDRLPKLTDVSELVERLS